MKIGDGFVQAARNAIVQLREPLIKLDQILIATFDATRVGPWISKMYEPPDSNE
jgi:hypothetical protein